MAKTSSTVVDYVGRLSDILIWDGASPSKETLLTAALAMPGEGGKITTGIQKLAQKFLLLLLTERGSLPYTPEFGTGFMVRLQTVRTVFEAEQAFQSALIDIKRQLRAEELSTDNDDERLDTATILSITLSEGRLSYKIRMVSMAGTARVVIFPLPITPFPAR